jgi:adenylosuccinate lyase
MPVDKYNFETYLSPFTWRYGSSQMRRIFSEQYKYELWRRIWVALAAAQFKAGLVTKAELDDLRANQQNIDIERAQEIEKETRHDVVAAIKEYAEKATVGGGKIHLGATSMDIVDNADTVRYKEALSLIKKRVDDLLEIFCQKIKQYAYFPCLGYTHLQPAEPTTLGYRLAFYAQDLLLDRNLLSFTGRNLKTKGMKGAVGTAASFIKLMGEKQGKMIEQAVVKDLDLKPFLITNQTTPRKVDYFISSTLVSIAQSLYKFAFDVRIMQSPGFGEWQEPFGKKQVGSSAMPFKKNPWKSEQICSLSRLVFNLSGVAAENSAHMLLERTLDDSANKRVYLPEMFLAVDEMTVNVSRIIEGLVVNKKRITRNLEDYAPFAATEEILLETVKKGADRQMMHEALREIALKAWEAIQQGHPNPMVNLLKENKLINKFLSKNKIKQLLTVHKHIGDAPKRALTLVQEIKQFKREK